MRDMKRGRFRDPAYVIRNYIKVKLISGVNAPAIHG